VTTLQPQERSSPSVASRIRGSSSITTTSLATGAVRVAFMTVGRQHLSDRMS
jgi:hypothetical protein